MADADALARLRLLAGKQLPVDGQEPLDYTDAQLLQALALTPSCAGWAGHPTHDDPYAAAAMLWSDKALRRELEQTAAGGDGVLVTSVKQADASVTYARPTPLGGGVTQPNDPAAMRALAARLLRRGCGGARFRSADVAPSEVVQPGRRGIREWDGGDFLYTDPRDLILDNMTNPDRVLNLPEQD